MRKKSKYNWLLGVLCSVCMLGAGSMAAVNFHDVQASVVSEAEAVTEQAAESSEAADAVASKAETATAVDAAVSEPEAVTEPAATEMEYKFAFQDDTKAVYEIRMEHADVADGEIVRVAVWSAENGQDDIKWYELKKLDDNTYGVDVRMANFSSVGNYYAHLYRFKTDGSAELLKAETFYVESIVGPKLSVEDLNRTSGTAVLKLTGLDGVSGVKIPVWSTANQSDIYWYTASKKSDGWYVTVDMAKHKNNWGIYYAHAYAVKSSGAMEMIDAVTLDFALKGGQMEVAFTDGKIGAKVSFPGLSAPKGIKEIRIAAWSANGGQDDIAWHVIKSGSNWSQTLDLSHIKSAGVCHLHAYALKSTGELVLLDAESFTIASPTLASMNVTTNNSTGAFTVTFDKPESPNGIAKLEVEVWSKSDKSDAKIYTAQKQSEGTYKVSGNISNHDYNVGTYHVQVLVTDNIGLTTSVKYTTMKFNVSVGNVVVSGDGKELLYNVRLAVDEFPAGLKAVQFAVWSAANGQDDINWYTATKSGNTYSCTVDIRNHKTMGSYYIHAYGTNNAGKQVFLNNGALNVTKSPSGYVIASGKNETKGTFDLKVYDLQAPSGINTVQIAVWSTANQSDICWYTATKQSDGTYKATVDLKNHNYNVGTFNIHVYAVMGNQIQSFVKASIYTFKPSNYLYILKDQGNGKRTIVLRNPSRTSNLRFAVWSETNGQDDIVWYTASKTSDGLWKATIDALKHEDSGIFHVHTYADSTMLANTSFDFPKSEFAKDGWYYERYNGRTYKLYYDKGTLVTDVESIIGKQSSYRAEVNRTTCTVTIYAKDGNNGYIIPVKTFTCSVGLPSTPTPTGTFYTSEKYRWHELMGPSYGQYCTRIVGGILFHSVAGSNMTSYNLSASAYNKLGQPASHGCVRLCVRDAKWIYDNCSLGMQVRIYDSSYPGPFGKPATIKIPSWQNWDPTDPAVKK